MSAEKINQTRYKCTCELSDCSGHGASWTSKDEAIPERCAHCGRRTWNGIDARRNRFITAHGKTKRLSDWAKETGLSASLIRQRIKTWGWTEEDAVTVPARKWGEAK